MLPNHCQIDDFLAPKALAALRAHTRAHRDAFKASKVIAEGTHRNDPAVRQSSKCKAGLGSAEAPFRRAIDKVSPRLFDALNIPVTPIVTCELELVAHRDGAFFKPHLDTFAGVNREGEASDRLISIVYYFHLGPRGFRGGDLVLHPFVPGAEPLPIAPEDNRLVAFPSFAWHEVSPVEVPGDAFEDARFAVNCWLHRARGG